MAMGSGFRTLPTDIKAQIDAIGDVTFVFGAARRHTPEQQAAWVDALGLDEVNDSQWMGVPRVNTGRWSKWNIAGRIKVMHDLPKGWHSWSWEAPNFRGMGTHTVSRGREVFQKHRLYGRQVEASVALVEEPVTNLVGTVLLELQGPYDPANDEEYLYAASLARTWFGSVSVLPLNEAGIPQIPDSTFGWEFLPDGTHEEIRVVLERRFGSRTSRDEIDIMIDRLERVQSLRPERRMVGMTGLQRYIGYQFGPDFVAFENPRVGNALYILRGDWQELSQLSRSQLLASRPGEFDRIIHTANWFDKLRLAVFDYRHSR
jgi:hypothetical protein